MYDVIGIPKRFMHMAWKQSTKTVFASMLCFATLVDYLCECELVLRRHYLCNSFHPSHFDSKIHRYCFRFNIHIDRCVRGSAHGFTRKALKTGVDGDE